MAQTQNRHFNKESIFVDHMNSNKKSHTLISHRAIETNMLANLMNSNQAIASAPKRIIDRSIDSTQRQQHTPINAPFGHADQIAKKETDIFIQQQQQQQQKQQQYLWQQQQEQKECLWKQQQQLQRCLVEEQLGQQQCLLQQQNQQCLNEQRQQQYLWKKQLHQQRQQHEEQLCLWSKKGYQQQQCLLQQQRQQKDCLLQRHQQQQQYLFQEQQQHCLKQLRQQQFIWREQQHQQHQQHKHQQQQLWQVQQEQQEFLWQEQQQEQQYLWNQKQQQQQECLRQQQHNQQQEYLWQQHQNQQLQQYEQHQQCLWQQQHNMLTTKFNDNISNTLATKAETNVAPNNITKNNDQIDWVLVEFLNNLAQKKKQQNYNTNKNALSPQIEKQNLWDQHEQPQQEKILHQLEEFINNLCQQDKQNIITNAGKALNLTEQQPQHCEQQQVEEQKQQITDLEIDEFFTNERSLSPIKQQQEQQQHTNDSFTINENEFICGNFTPTRSKIQNHAITSQSIINSNTSECVANDVDATSNSTSMPDNNSSMPATTATINPTETTKATVESDRKHDNNLNSKIVVYNPSQHSNKSKSNMPSGIVAYSGGKRELEKKMTAQQNEHIQRLGYGIKLHNYRVYRIVGSCKMPWIFDVDKFAFQYKYHCCYETKQHVAVVYELSSHKASVSFDTSGSFVAIASNVTVLRILMERIYTLISELRKHCIPEINSTLMNQMDIKQNVFLNPRN